jgi:hypothetical protein
LSIGADDEQAEISAAANDVAEKPELAAYSRPIAVETAADGPEQDLARFAAELKLPADEPMHLASALNKAADAERLTESDEPKSGAARALEATAASPAVRPAEDPADPAGPGTAPVPENVGTLGGTKSNRLTAAEAALAQARAELAAAAALLDTTWPRLVEAKPAAESAAETSDDDLEDLFEPQPDAALDPNAVLLGAATPPASGFALHPTTAAVLPVHEMALKPQSDATTPEVTSSEASMREPPKPPAPVDPLAHLKAMSDEEKIALFS